MDPSEVGLCGEDKALRDATIAELRSKVQQLTDLNIATLSEREDVYQRYHSVSMKVSELETQLAECQRKLGESQRQLTHAREALEESRLALERERNIRWRMEASPSWKMTRPIRTISSLLQRTGS